MSWSTSAGFPALNLCQACGAVLLAKFDEPPLELLELHYYARPPMQHVVSEPHTCPMEVPA